MTPLGYAALAASTLFVAYTYAGYPLLLALLGVVRKNRRPAANLSRDSDAWPTISITVPMYNEEAQAAELIESLLALDYPPEKRQILVVSDASSDRTDEIVRSYADRGVELLRLSERAGKTAAENAAASRLTGEIVVNTDASIRIRPDALKPLVAALEDPEVGLASGRDVSVSRTDEDPSLGESGYVGYEMRVRDLETATSGIVGASGCLYAIRRELHRPPVPRSLSRDFIAALRCRERGYAAVSVPGAVCYVPRSASLEGEYRRKVRTMTRGMETLLHRKRLLNPLEHGLFAWKLWSHKVCRWAVPWAALGGVVGLALLAPAAPWALALLAAGGGGILLGAAGWRLGARGRAPLVLQLAGFGLMGNVAAMHAALRTAHGDRDPIWEPTRRQPATSG